MTGLPGDIKPPRQLPTDVAGFTGRDVELRAMNALLSNGSPSASSIVISAIAGSPGIGKTSLAVHWAHQVKNFFPDGQLYANLRGYDANPSVTTDDVLDAFLRALGLPMEHTPRSGDARAATYRSLMAGRRMLVVLDNAANPEQIRPLLPNEPACLVLVTSRSRLSGLVAHDGARRISLDVLSETDALSLLRGTIGPDRVNEESTAVADLAQRCAFLPLALRVAAERVVSRPHHAVADLVRELDDERRRIQLLSIGDDETTAVRTVFSWSYRALDHDSARMFRRLGLHPGPTIGLHAASALLGQSPERTRHLLDVLIGMNLVSEYHRDRFQFHDLLRAYARECAEADEGGDQQDIAITRLFCWYLHTAHAALFSLFPQHPEVPCAPPVAGCRPLAFTDREEALQWFTTEHANLMTLIQQAASLDQHTVGWQLPNIVDCYLCDEFHNDDQIAAHRQGLAIARQIEDKIAQCWALNHLGEALYGNRQFEDAIACHEQALLLARQIGDKFGEGAAGGDLASIYLELGDYERAICCAQSALEVYTAINHRRNIGLTSITLGVAMGEIGKLKESAERIEYGIQVATAAGVIGLQGNGLRRLAHIRQKQGRNEEAIQLLRESIAIGRANNYRWIYGAGLHQLGLVLAQMGSLPEAHSLWAESVKTFEDIDSHSANKVRQDIARFSDWS